MRNADEHDDPGTNHSEQPHTSAAIAAPASALCTVARVNVTGAASASNSQLSGKTAMPEMQALRTLVTRINAAESGISETLQRTSTTAISEIEVFCGRLTADQKAIVFVDNGEINIIDDSSVTDYMVKRTCNPVIISIGFERRATDFFCQG